MAIAGKNNSKADIKVFWICPILFYLFILLEVFCPGLQLGQVKLGQPCFLGMKLRGDLGPFLPSKMNLFPKISTIYVWQSPNHASEATENINWIRSVCKKRQETRKERSPFSNKHSYLKILIILNIVYHEVKFEIIFPCLNILSFSFFYSKFLGFSSSISRNWENQ